MSASRSRLYASLLADMTATTATQTRYVELEASLRVCDADREGERCTWRTSSDEELLRVGGRWDRRKKRWAGEASSEMVFRVHRGQEEAARWFAAWIRCKRSGDWSGFRRVWSAMLVGGRRSGKSHLAVIALVLNAIAFPGSVAWAVSPTLDANTELDRALVAAMPRAWFKRRELTTGRSLTFKLANGSRIELRSGHKARSLKAGRVDMALLNEGQLIEHKAFVNVRGGVADRAGLVLIAANPPDEPVGRWIENYFVAARAETIEGVAFEFDPRKNPFVEYSALTSQAAETDERTYQREVLGLFTPIGDVVFHAWAPDNVRAPDDRLVDITAKVARRELGRIAGYILGIDLQKSPACVAAVFKIFASPEQPNEELAFVVDEFEAADEDELLSMMETSPRWQLGGRIGTQCYRGWTESTDAAIAPVHAASVLDASSWWQDSTHTAGTSTDRIFTARRWRENYRPNAKSDKNPDLLVRMRVGNSRLHNAAGVRRLFVAPWCKETIAAMRLYPNRHGKPDRTNEHAHRADTVTYVTFRLYGDVKPARLTTPAYVGDRAYAGRNRDIFGPGGSPVDDDDERPSNARSRGW